MNILLKPAALLLAFMTVAGCTSVPADQGRADIHEQVAGRGLMVPEPADAADFVRQQLAAPLTADAAVQIALVRSPVLRREFAALGFSAAELYDAGRMANPVLSAARMTSGDPAAAGAQLSLGIAIDLTSLLLQPARQRYSAAAFEATKLSVGAALLEHAAAVQAAWYRAVVAEQQLVLHEAVAGSSAAASALAERYFAAGNISRRELALAKAEAGSAQAEAINARSAVQASRNELNRLMGLAAAENGWTLAADLARPPDALPPLPELLQLAAAQRLDVAAAGRRAEAVARRYRLERNTRFVGGIELGYEREQDFDGYVNRGPSIGIELPLFRRSGNRVAKAELALAEAELDQRALDAGNEVAAAWQQAQAARQRVRLYHDTILPQRGDVVARLQEELNYMLVGTAELLAARHQEYEAGIGFIQALGDYWQAETELARAVGGRLPANTSSATSAPSTSAPSASTPPAHTHSGSAQP